MATLILLLVGLHRLADWRSGQTGQFAPVTIDLQTAATVHPAVATVEPSKRDPTAYQLLDAAGAELAIVTQTAPQSDAIVGYAGPSNLLVVMNGDWVVQSVRLLRCPDTAEHLQIVQSNQKFWQQFVGWKWGETATVEVDGVTGSTLTSLAIAEAVAWRLSHQPGAPAEPAPLVRRSLRFPNPIAVETITRWFETAVAVRENPAAPYLVECFDETGMLVGEIIRTGPLDDTVVGYQGPTEVILRVEQSSGSSTGPEINNLDRPMLVDAMLVDAMLGETFDNQPYVNYVKQERSFWKRFRNRSLQSLATIDFDAEMIDGVSGATMTSMAVAETIRRACGKWIEVNQATAAQAVLADQPPSNATAGPTRQRTLNTSSTEWLTGGIALVALWWSRSRLRGRRWLRIAWQITMLVSIGWISGNLLSLALLGGWTRGGIAWHFAPGLAILAAVTMLAPAVMKGNVYCDHVCPHGILQQWIRPRQGRSLPPRIKTLLRTSAVILIAVALIAVVLPAKINLAWFEPFDAYASGVLMSLSALICAASLVLSRITPMGYCRHACPTGRLLDYTRRDRSRHQITLIDAVLIIATLALWFPSV